MVNMKLIPVAMGMIIEKLFVESALKKARAESMIRTKAATNVRFKTSFNHSPTDSKLLPFNCHLIRAAPETLSKA